MTLIGEEHALNMRIVKEKIELLDIGENSYQPIIFLYTAHPLTSDDRLPYGRFL